MERRDYKVVEGDMSELYDKRYVVIDSETGEIIDDAQGFGYKSKRKAHAAYIYKTRRKKSK